MANLTSIDSGQAGWDKTLMDDLNLINFNTGWVTVPLTNVTGTSLGNYLLVRRTNYHVDIKAQFAVATAGDITIGTIPDNLITSDWRFLQGFVAGLAVISVTLDDKFKMIAHVPTSAINKIIDIDTTIAYSALRIH